MTRFLRVLLEWMLELLFSSKMQVRNGIKTFLEPKFFSICSKIKKHRVYCPLKPRFRLIGCLFLTSRMSGPPLSPRQASMISPGTPLVAQIILSVKGIIIPWIQGMDWFVNSSQLWKTAQDYKWGPVHLFAGMYLYNCSL